jgi:hypothetical protein
MAAKHLGESPASTQSAMAALVPAVLGTLAQKGSTPEGAGSLLGLINSPNVSADPTASVGALFAGDGAGVSQLESGGQGLVNALLGDKAASLANALGSMSGMKASSAANLLAMVVPLILGFLRKWVGQQGLDASGLSSLLAGQGEHLKNALDPRLASALGFSSPSAFLGGIGPAPSAAAERVTGAAAGAATAAGNAAAGAASAAGSAVSTAASEAKRSLFARPWFWIVVAIIIVLLFLMNR